MSFRYPVLGLCGYSGSGKTTLIEKLIEAQVKLGRNICVIKHDGHKLQVDKEGKDSDRFFKMGSDVVIRSNEQSFYRTHQGDTMPLEQLLNKLAPYYDAIIVEGHKDTKMDNKIWLKLDDAEEPPESIGCVDYVLGRNDNRFEIVHEKFEEIIQSCWKSSPVIGAVLMGGESSRFGSPKHLHIDNGKTWLEKSVEVLEPHVDKVVLLGKGEIPSSLKHLDVLCDAPNLKGPIAGMVAAARWSPLSSWIFVPCDLPYLSRESIEWLLSNRTTGTIAIQPKLSADSPSEPLLAFYDFRCSNLFETTNRPQSISTDKRVKTPLIPDHLKKSWTNINALDQLSLIR